MATVREITVPITKPATEWVRALQKVSPQEPHARAQSRMLVALLAWADATGSGRIGPEWEFRLTPPGEVTRPLVPDIAFLSYDRLGYDEDRAAQIPHVAPDVAIEIISSGDRRADIEDKVRVYLAAGAKLVLLVDPARRTFVVRDSNFEKAYGPDDVFEHPSLPAFVLRVGSVFEKVKPKNR